jgi:hypothetical protein
MYLQKPASHVMHAPMPAHVSALRKVPESHSTNL